MSFFAEYAGFREVGFWGGFEGVALQGESKGGFCGSCPPHTCPYTECIDHICHRRL